MWMITKEDVVNAVNLFYRQERFEKSLNSTYIALIPKKPGAVQLRDFSPISLIGGCYKILAKVLTERLKLGVHKLVDNPSMAFGKTGRLWMQLLLLTDVLTVGRRKINLVFFANWTLRKHTTM